MNLYEVFVKVAGQKRTYIVAASDTMYAEAKISTHVPGALVVRSRPRGTFLLTDVMEDENTADR